MASGRALVGPVASDALSIRKHLRGGTVTGSGASAVRMPDPSGPIPSSNAGTFPFYCDTHYNLDMMGAVFVAP